MTPAVEDYLKTIFLLTTRGETVTTGALAKEMAVSSPSVSAMVKRLEDGELVRRGRSIDLTDRGEAVALRVVRRHRLLETFLVEALDMPWDEVHEEAEQLEHAVSDRLEARIDAALGHPTHDPHGDPIPRRAGRHDESWGQPLAAAPEGSRFRIDRVSDRLSDALRYLGERGLRPGVVLDVDELEPYGGPRWVRVAGERIPLAPLLAGMIHGSVEGGGSETGGSETGGSETGGSGAGGSGAGGVETGSAGSGGVGTGGSGAGSVEAGSAGSGDVGIGSSDFGSVETGSGGSGGVRTGGDTGTGSATGPAGVGEAGPG